MQYNIARYECQLGNLNQAREHLDAAFALSGGLHLRPRSLDEPDLAPLWQTLRPALIPFWGARGTLPVKHNEEPLALNLHDSAQP